MSAFVEVRCPKCDNVLFDETAMRGIVRVKCKGKRGCGQRVWVGGAEDGPVVVQVDRAE